MNKPNLTVFFFLIAAAVLLTFFSYFSEEVAVHARAAGMSRSGYVIKMINDRDARDAAREESGIPMLSASYDAPHSRYKGVGLLLAPCGDNAR